MKILDDDLDSEWLSYMLLSDSIGVDIETSGLNKETDRIATVQMYSPEYGSVLVRNLDNPKKICALLENPSVRKIFHYAGFDLVFLVRDYNIWPQNIACTRIAAKILDPKKELIKHPETGKGSHSLIALLKHYFDVTITKELAISNWFTEDLTDAQLVYAENDVKYLPELLRKLETDLLAAGLYTLAREAMKHIPTHVILTVKKYNGIFDY